MKIRYEFLTSPITPRQLQEFSKQAEGKLSFAYSSTFSLIAGGLVGLLQAMGLLHFFITSTQLGAGGILGVFLLAVVGFMILGFFVGRLIRQATLTRLYRLTNFARANGWSYSRKLANPSHPGIIFDQGHDRYTKDQIYSSSGDMFEIGNYYYTTGSGKNRQTHDWGYVCIKLKRRVPHMILDAKANNWGIFGMNMSNLPESLRGNSTLSLEGDFDKYFTLYAPKEYERDALYIFTPDLMALLIDESAQFDVEVVDDRMYIYSSTKFDVMKPSTLEKIFTIINQVGEEMIDQTDYYADERVGDRAANVIAPGGRRLKQSVPVFVIVIIVIYVIYFIFGFLGS